MRHLLLLVALCVVCPSPLLGSGPPPALSLLDETGGQPAGGPQDIWPDAALEPSGYRLLAEAGQDKTGEAPEGEFGNVTEEEVEKAPVAEAHIADPLEKWNRFWFKFNDRFYFWLMKPVARDYGRAVPEDFRTLFNNFYRNVTSPIKIINNLLQLKIKNAGSELLRLLINSTMGVGGLRECAGECFGIHTHNNDFGTTLGFYRIGPGFYVVWPVLGPSTARDSVGLAGDALADPMTWFLPPLYVSFPLRVHDRVNYLSFHLGDYESLKKASLDPYIAVRSAYVQNRAAAISE